jgi:hypothetical protein
LYYHLNNNPVQHLWQKMYSTANKFKMELSSKLTKGELVANINKLSDIKLTTPVTQEQLNHLHNQFVWHGKNNMNSETWEAINQMIHLLEDKLRHDWMQDCNGSLGSYIDPEPERITLKEEHKLWLTTEKRWGDLLLGYATLGKGWWEISQDNDNTDDLNLQKYIGSETWCIFQPETILYKDIENQFYSWAKDTSVPVPLDNLNQLAMGRYYLGKLIITDELLKFHNNTSDWYVPNHVCKYNWAKEVITKDSKIEKVNFFDSDIYFESLSHTGLDFHV